jgi:exodeoxyribonuclease VII small subunit
MAEKFNYEKAKAELEEILEALESGETSVDQLAKHVKRAAELIRLCKDKLRQTDQELQQVLKSFDEEDK